MADDKILSMSLDEIIKLKRGSGQASSSQSLSQTRRKTGTRGRANFAVYRRRGRIGVASNRNFKRGASVPYRNSRGVYRKRGYRVGLRNLPLRIEDRILQRQQNMALARNRIQMAKRFLNSRQRMRGAARRNMGSIGRFQFRRMSSRGYPRGQGNSRGRGGLRVQSNLLLNTFRSNHIARINTYRNKVNRSLSAAMRNQVPAAPSLIVSIENERAGTPSVSGIRGGRRGLRKRGNMGRQNVPTNVPTMQLTNDAYQQRNTTPFHTGALNPEIQRMIADIQGKANPTNGRISASQRGFGSTRGQRGLGRGQFLARQLNSRPIDGLNVGLPKTTACTLNERFGGWM